MSDLEPECPLCQSDRTNYDFTDNGRRFHRCIDCELLFLHQGSPSILRPNRHNKSSESFTSPNESIVVSRTREYLAWLQSRRSLESLKVIVSGDDSGVFCRIARDRRIEAFNPNPDQLVNGNYDVCVLINSFGREQQDIARLGNIRDCLSVGGLLLIVVPVLDRKASRKHPSLWPKRYLDRALLFNRHNLSALLVKTGFSGIEVATLENSSVIICTKEELRADRQPDLSIVLPIYNEKSTLEMLLNKVMEKSVGAIGKEIIIVESNSSDGSRELVRKYEDHHGVRVIYEDRPRGKGHAVRSGLRQATGKIILIQDADLEYDVEDYDSLIEPILAHRKLFVLGSRHKGDWKMREFENRRLLSALFNFGQVFFTGLINVFCGVKLDDPFTMYKVFHRECLYGLQLESNRFDLDWEIVIKFIRKGLVPQEIPVNYKSRSFGEGKKVRPIMDPCLWVIALFKFRYGALYVESGKKNHRSGNT